MINKAKIQTRRPAAWLLPILLIALGAQLAGCGKSADDGEDRSLVALPTDDTQPLNLYCIDVGIYTETCILDDPANPYARSIVSEDTKFELDADAPSATAKFYLWATALARGAGIPGENQFYVALYLHQVWASNNSEPVRLQAIRAYRSLLDNYFNSATFFEIPIGSGDYFPQDLNRFAGQMLFDPTDITNTYTSTRLFSPDPAINRDMADMEVGSWGYLYDQTTETFSVIF